MITNRGDIFPHTQFTCATSLLLCSFVFSWGLSAPYRPPSSADVKQTNDDPPHPLFALFFAKYSLDYFSFFLSVCIICYSYPHPLSADPFLLPYFILIFFVANHFPSYFNYLSSSIRELVRLDNMMTAQSAFSGNSTKRT